MAGNNPSIDVDAFASSLRDDLRSLQSVRVRGVVGKVTLSSAGHAYFDLVGKSGRVPCVVWASTARRCTVVPGEAIVTVQHVDFYPPSGKLQAVVSGVESTSDAPYCSDKEKVLARLHAEGFTLRARKPLPDLVRHLCLVTSVGSAAYHDMRRSIEERWPGLRVTVVDTLVQGEQAATRLVDAIRKADELQACLIICGRGGGSEADLATFDDEGVARAVAACKTPVVSAVGHESDHSVCDAVADARAKTPTAAVQLALPRSLQERLDEVRILRETVENAFRHAVAALDARRSASATSLAALLRRMIRSEGARHASLRAVLQSAARHRLAAAGREAALRRERLAETARGQLRRQEDAVRACRGKLSEGGIAACHRCALSVGRLRAGLASSSPYPSPGLAAVYSANGKRVMGVADLSCDDQIRVQLADGQVLAVVRQCRPRTR